jgi:hypothetical protein
MLAATVVQAYVLARASRSATPPQPEIANLVGPAIFSAI